MTRYYLFINREYTKIFKKNETEPIIQIEYDQLVFELFSVGEQQIRIPHTPYQEQKPKFKH